MLTKEQILKADDIETVTVDVPEWGEGGEVTIITMTGAERDEFEQAFFDSKENKAKATVKNIRARLCAMCIVNGDGERMFSDSDIAALGEKSCVPIDRIFAAAQKLNALTPDDIDDLAKNSESDQSESSTLT